MEIINPFFSDFWRYGNIALNQRYVDFEKETWFTVVSSVLLFDLKIKHGSKKSLCPSLMKPH